MLHFRIGPFPVRVEGSFLLAAVILGGLGIRSALDIAAWVLIVFISVLVHELGHAVVGLSLGGQPEIVLRGMGGVTFARLRTRPTWMQLISLSLAGPLAGLLPGVAGFIALAVRNPALVAGGTHLWPQIVELTYAPDPVDRLCATFAEMSVVWTLLNLIPVEPLDGGHVLEIALTAARKKPSVVLAAWISTGVAAALAAFIFARTSGWWTAGIFFVLLAISNAARARALGGLMNAAAAQPAGPDAAARAQVAAALAQARAALTAQDPQGALRAAEPLDAAPDGFRQAGAARIRAGVALSRGEHLEAGRQAGRAFSLSPDPEAAVVAARAALRAGQPDVARTWLKRALESGAPAEALRADDELGAIA